MITKTYPHFTTEYVAEDDVLFVLFTDDKVLEEQQFAEIEHDLMEVLNASEHGGIVMLDFQPVTHMSSASLSTWHRLKAAAHSKGKKFVSSHLCTQARTIFAITGVEVFEDMLAETDLAA